MNRHMRRAAATQRKRDGNPADIVEKLQVHLAQIDGLQQQLASAAALLGMVRKDNEALRASLAEQQEINRRLFARSMGVSVDTVISMEVEFQHAIQSSHSEATEVSDHSSP